LAIRTSGSEAGRSGRTGGRGRAAEWLLTLPSFSWLVGLVLVPTLIVVAIAFRPADPYGGVGQGWTLATFASLSNPRYPEIVWRTLWISVVTTVLCVVISLPVGYCLARAAPRLRRVLLLAVVVPFWTSFLIRVFAWKVVLHPDGALKRGLVMLGLLEPNATLLYSPAAVLLVMVYSYLPFAILPLYAAAERFDFQLVEAARDLGAGRFQAFRKVFIPGISRGLGMAILVVLIPALGTFVIPDLVGGPSAEMIGNTIARRVFVDRNLPHAAALSALLTVAVLLPMLGRLMLRDLGKARLPEQEP
jgi:spermidine/putrescine transport system permease protein